MEGKEEILAKLNIVSGKLEEVIALLENSALNQEKMILILKDVLDIAKHTLIQEPETDFSELNK